MQQYQFICHDLVSLQVWLSGAICDYNCFYSLNIFSLFVHFFIVLEEEQFIPCQSNTVAAV